ncbi:PREDICTED: uncharacterized protein LOC104799445 [Tarenaya hassleriana]|uniref:uncharacterized protein LOC104799445 n=1 Tax=Tarenaya hassleriana TaxID=28532 RepID=UPI00053C937C|nr:PREDICTED: uncharacterized protein LOC104799445 [Tarenaya hassleriana]
MSNTEILLPKEDFAVMKSESSTTLSETQDPDSSPRDQIVSANPSKTFQSQRQEQERLGQVQEHEEFVDRARRKRKRDECGVAPLQIPDKCVVSTTPATGEYSGEGFETPKSILVCRRRRDSEVDDVEVRNASLYRPPPPPRKPKTAPATKRRAMWFRSSLGLLDVSREVESMFPPSVLEDFGKKIRKASS